MTDTRDIIDFWSSFDPAVVNDEEKVGDEEFLKVIFGPVGLITKDEDKKLTESAISS